MTAYKLKNYLNLWSFGMKKMVNLINSNNWKPSLTFSWKQVWKNGCWWINLTNQSGIRTKAVKIFPNQLLQSFCPFSPIQETLKFQASKIIQSSKFRMKFRNYFAYTRKMKTGKSKKKFWSMKLRNFIKDCKFNFQTQS